MRFLTAGVALLLSIVSLRAAAQTADFSASLAEYQSLKQQAKGGTQLSWSKLPDWSGIWTGGRQAGSKGIGVPNMSARKNNAASAADGAEYPQLTPEYQARLDQSLAEKAKGIEIGWDYISACIPSGHPRWVMSHFLKEFVITPGRTWLMNEEQSEVRRIYTDGRDHVERDSAFPLFEGDSIGFWSGDTLVVHTIDNKVGAWDRSGVAYSDQVNTVERIRKINANTIEDRMTIYDAQALKKPWHLVFNFIRITDPPDLRINMWSCNENNNAQKDADGTTHLVLPGEAGYKDPGSFATHAPDEKP